MRYWMLLWLLFALPVQALLALDAGHCPASLSASQNQPVASAHGAEHVGAGAHCEAQPSSHHMPLKHCQSCVLCPALNLLAMGAGSLLTGLKAPQLAALQTAHSSRHGEVLDKPPKFSACA